MIPEIRKTKDIITQSLRLLPPRPSVRRDLNQHIRLRQIKARIRDFAHKYRVDFRVKLEVLQYLYPLPLRRGSVDVGAVHLDGVVS